jgi:hypothetical protein
MFCQEDLDESRCQHTRKNCPTFKSLKRNTSSTSYIRSSLKHEEEIGFAAAGVLLWRRFLNDSLPAKSDCQNSETNDIEVLMARECRAPNRDCDGDLLNFLGGKRLHRSSTALKCAVDKVNQETGYQFPPATIASMKDGCPLVSWSSNSKYVLYIFELVDDDDRDIDIRCAGIGGTSIKRLEWTPIRKLVKSKNFARTQMHRFAGEMLEDLITSNILTHLEDLFNIAYKPNVVVQKKPKEEILPMSEFLSLYDVRSALQTMLAAVTQERQSVMPKIPSFFDLHRAVQIIPKRDMHKLLLRLHPDRLSQVLRRQPNEIETKIATMATQALNGLKETSNEADVMTNLKKLDEFRKKEMNPFAGKGAEDGNTVALDEMLSRLSIGKIPKSKSRA